MCISHKFSATSTPQSKKLRTVAAIAKLFIIMGTVLAGRASSNILKPPTLPFTPISCLGFDVYGKVEAASK